MKMKILDRGVESLRQPDRLPRCYELTEDERLAIIKKWEYHSRRAREIGSALLRENKNA